MQERVQRDLTRAEDQNDQPRDEKDERRGAGELVGRGEEGHQRLAVGRNVGNQHVAYAQQRQQARSQAQSEENSANKLQQRDEPRIGGGSGYPETGKKLDDVRDVVQLAPAGLRKLPAPVEPHRQQKHRLQR